MKADQSRVPGRGGKRLAIIDGALSTFLADGYLATSMDRIAVVAGVSKRTIYNHFASKDELFIAIIGDLADEILYPIDRSLIPVKNAEEALTHFAHYYAEAILSGNRIMLHRLVLGEIGRFPELGAYYYQGYQRAEKGVAQMLQKFSMRGMLSIDNFEQAASTFWHLTLSALHNQLLFSTTLSYQDLDVKSVINTGVRNFMLIYKK